jgi:hypothetical protein
LAKAIKFISNKNNALKINKTSKIAKTKEKLTISTQSAHSCLSLFSKQASQENPQFAN